MSSFSLAQSGDPDALAALVRQHVPLVQALTKRFSYNEDAFQQGCMGLVMAIRRFREQEGTRFSTYAVPVILGEMRRTFSHSLGWRSRAVVRKALAYQNQALVSSGQAPTIQEAAAHAGCEPTELVLLLEVSQPLLFDESGALFSSLPDPGGDRWLTRLLVRDILARMPGKESHVLSGRYVWGRTQSELARALHTTQSTISRLEKQARQHFRQAWTE